MPRLEEENKRLKAKNEALEARVRELEKQLEAQSCFTALQTLHAALVGKKQEDELPPVRRNACGVHPHAHAHARANEISKFAPFVPQVEIEPIFRDAFSLFDADGNGHLDTEELAQALEVLNIYVDIERAQEIMDKYDDDQNGTLEVGEFRNMCVELIEEQGLTIDDLRPREVIRARLSDHDATV